MYRTYKQKYLTGFNQYKFHRSSSNSLEKAVVGEKSGREKTKGADIHKKKELKTRRENLKYNP